MFRVNYPAPEHEQWKKPTVTGTLMDTRFESLWHRERARREALRCLENLRPGAEAAQAQLVVLKDIDVQDREHPIGEACAMTIEELREHVPVTPFEGSDGYPFMIVLDQHVPEPWRMRFGAATVGSARLREGGYASDWRRFLRLWEREIQHVMEHRKAWQN